MPNGIGEESVMPRAAMRGGNTILLAENESWLQILGEKQCNNNKYYYLGGRGPVIT